MEHVMPQERGYFSLDQNEALLQDQARKMQLELGDILNKDITYDTLPMDTGVFAGIYNSSRPTIAVDILNSFSGVELLGYTAARQIDKTANVIYFAGPDSGLAQTADGTYITHGMVVRPDGRVMRGKLPQAVAVHVVETQDSRLLAACAESGIPTLVSETTANLSADKRQLATLLAAQPELLPRRYTPDELSDVQKPVVIKPSQDAQGNGVYISTESTTVTEPREVYDFLDTSGCQPVIEDRIVARPMHDPKTGDRLDWNVRAIICNGQYIDMYVRAGHWGKPVNKSRGAQAIPIHDMDAYMPGAADVINTLTQTAITVGETLQDGLLGVDITVDEAGDPYVFEINGGRVGGLQTMARIDKTKLPTANTEIILQTIVDGAARAEQSGDKPSRLGTLAVSAATLAEASIRLGLAPMEGPMREPVVGLDDRHATFFKLINARRQLLFSLKAADQLASVELDKQLVAEHPLELRYHLSLLIADAKDPAVFADFAKKMSRLYPLEVEWQIAETMVAARSLKLDAIRQDFLACTVTGSTREKLLDALAAHTLHTISIRTSVDNMPDELYNSLVASTRQAIVHGYTAGITELNDRQPDNPSQDDLSYFQMHGFMLSLTAGEYDHAYAFLQTIVDNPIASMWMDDYILNNPQLRQMCLQDAEGVIFLGKISTELGLFTPSLETIVIEGSDYFQAAGPDIVSDIARQLTEYYLAEDMQDRELFSAQLQDLLLASDAGLAENDCPVILDDDSSDTIKYSYLLWHTVNSVYHSQIRAVLASLEGNDHGCIDLDYIATYMADLAYE